MPPGNVLMLAVTPIFFSDAWTAVTIDISAGRSERAEMLVSKPLG